MLVASHITVPILTVVPQGHGICAVTTPQGQWMGWSTMAGFLCLRPRPGDLGDVQEEGIKKDLSQLLAPI